MGSILVENSDPKTAFAALRRWGLPILPARARAMRAWTAALAVAFAVAAQAQAQPATTLVSNIGQPPADPNIQHTTTIVGQIGQRNIRKAMFFTTGDNPGGYTLSAVDLRIYDWVLGADTLQVSVWTTSTRRLFGDIYSEPDSSLHTLTNPSSITPEAINTFSASAGATLDANTTYAVVLAAPREPPLSFDDEIAFVDFEFTMSGSEDPGGASGWHIAHYGRSSTNLGPWLPATDPVFAIKGMVNQTNPSVDRVAVSSDAGTDGTYAIGDVISLKATFDESVNVTTAGAPVAGPHVPFTLGGATRNAVYASGSGTKELVFSYTVAAGDADANGIAVAADALALNGGTIRDADGNNATLTHAALPAQSSHKVDGVRPTVSGVAVSSDAGTDGTYAIGDMISLKATFDESVNVTTAGAPVAGPHVPFTLGGAARNAVYASGSGTTELVFGYTVAVGDAGGGRIEIATDALALNGGAIRDLHGNDATLAHAAWSSPQRGRSRLSAPPSAPAAPAVTGASSTGLSVSWSAPGNLGSASAITDYDLRYFAGTADPTDPDDWIEEGETNGPPDPGGNTSATITGLSPATAYRVQVRATGDGAGPWSASGAGRANAEAAAPLTASFVGMPDEHDGTSPFTFELRFSENFPGRLRYKMLRDEAFRVTNGRVRQAKRVAQGQNQRWTITVRPTSFEDVVVMLPAAAGCAAAGAVTVDYATSDGTAKAGEDYAATSGRLTFAAGEREKAIAVSVRDDALDEGEETFALRLSNATGARIVDGEATGTIANADPLQGMWLSRFGRTVAGHVTEAISDRLASPLTGARVAVGGRSVDLARTGDEASLGRTMTVLARALGAAAGSEPEDGGWPGPGVGVQESPALGSSSARTVSGRELLRGSAFHLTREGEDGGSSLAAWGRVAVGGFDGEAPAETGNVGIDGDVTTGILGADAAWERLLAGVAVSFNEGEGTFEQPGVDSGKVESSLTTVSPYARVSLSERVSAWGLLGFGAGDMTITQTANDRGQPERVTRTDLGMRLAAVGGRGTLLQAGETGGMDLALEADAFFVETESEAVSNEGSTTADASRVRLVLEGSRAFRMASGSVLTPGLELGLRHDGGDAETGTGVEVGGRIAWTDAGSGLSVEASVRTFIAHEDSDYEEWGASGSVHLAPGAFGRGLSFRLAPTWGAASSGVGRLWSARDARGLAPDGEFTPESRLEAELGYGLAAFGGGFTGTPNVGFGLSDAAREYRLGWRLVPARPGDSGFEVSLDATRRESASDDAAPENAIRLELRSRF